MVKPIVREAIVERRSTQVRWSAVIAGTITAIGAWITLQLLGYGVGLMSLDTDTGGNLHGVGVGTGVWAIIAPLLAVFVGALVGARLCGSRQRRIGALHGVVMWGLSTLLGVMAVISIVGSVASGALRVGSAVASAGQSAIGAVGSASGAGQDVAKALDIDTNDLLAPVNDYLRQQGKPAITADQLTATARGVAQRGLHGGHIDRQVLVDEIARNTSLSRADAEDLANRFGDRYDQVATKAQQRVDELGQQTKQVALDAANAAGHGMLWTGIALVVALLAALAGGALGVTRRPVEVVPETT